VTAPDGATLRVVCNSAGERDRLASSISQALGGGGAPQPPVGPGGGGAAQSRQPEKDPLQVMDRLGRINYKRPDPYAETVGPEEPLPGREKEYAAYQELLAAEAEQGGSGPAFVPPPISEERRNRSPGMQHNFYEVAQSDFKRPYGMRGAAPSAASTSPTPSTPIQAPAAAGTGTGSSAGPPTAQAPGKKVAADGSYEEVMPGREEEHAAYQAQLAEQSGQVAEGDTQRIVPLVRPPISEERRNRSPGMQHNFYEVALSDFKRSYGTPVGQPSPQPPPVPASATADDGLQPTRSAGAAPQPPTTAEGGQPADEAQWTRGGGVASADEAELTARVAQLERSNERLQVALSGVREREEAARLLAEEMAAKVS
jgi:hypothetical protein